jgi:hypothetical protein
MGKRFRRGRALDQLITQVSCPIEARLLSH